ncbi:ABC transporter substrate-binding protein [Clostridium sp. LY3-2]|uniref:ABC transporter substrate-binding protein n=1 Tax=Clostridium sp. LY3-2 TaxID=2942482 RepID=UPI0021524FA9|nr:ABC transporter substrate-binding protein [Clostridium sp. LY3-2]MCR6514543.1 ABC transporter substrate-binding protein [Clostridium sp. LY3-2]
MKKKFLALAVLTAMTASIFVGCGSKDANDKPKEALVTEINKPVTIEMWHYMTGKQQEVFDGLVDEFNKTNGKEITVKAVSQGGIQDLNKKVVTASQSDSLPAIINVYPDLATGLIDQGKLFDLSDYINDPKVGMKEEIEKDFIPSFTDEVKQWDGKQYGMPLSKSTEVVYVNKTLLEKLGYSMKDLENLTFDKLAEIAKKAHDKLGIAGFGFDSSSNAFISSLKMDGKDFVELNGTINVDNDWVKTFMDYFKKENESGAFRIPGEDKFLSPSFSNQKILMYQGSTAGASHIKTNGKFDIGVVQVPVFEGKKKAVIQQGASVFVTNNTTPEQKYAAYEFIKFITNKENSAKFAVETGYLPVRRSSADTKIVKAAMADKKSLYGTLYPVAEESLEYSYYTPAVNNAQSARKAVQEKYDAFVTGGIKTVDDFISQLQSAVQTSIGRR